MAVNFQPVAYPMLGGVDAKIHKYALPAPKLQRLENGVSIKTGSIERRSGRSALASTDIDAGTVTDWKALASYQGRLVAMTGSTNNEGERLYERTSLGWADRGTAFSARVSSQGLTTESGALFADSARDAAGLTVYAYRRTVTGGTEIAVTAIDTNGAVVVSGATLATSGTVPRVTASGSLIYVTYYDPTAAEIQCKPLDTTSAATLLASIAAAPATVATNMAVVSGSSVMDVVANATYGPCICYRKNVANTAVIGFLTTAGALTNNADVTGLGGDPTGIAIDVASNLTAHCIGYIIAGANNVFAAIRTYAGGGVWNATATSATIGGGAVGAVNVVVKWVSTSLARVVWSGDSATTTSTGNNYKMVQVTYSTGGVATTVATLRHCSIASNVWTDAGEYYVIVGTMRVASPSEQQRAYYVIRLSDSAVVACLEQNLCLDIPYGIHRPRVPALGASGSWTVPLPMGAVIDITQTTLRAFTIELAHAQSHKTIEVGESLYIAGSIPLQYDGVQVTESGILRFVQTDYVTLTPSNGAGALTVNVPYSYRIIPEWVNARGEIDRGTDSGAITVTMGVADDTVTISIPTISLTLKKSPVSNLRFAIYRTEDTPSSDAPFYRVGTVDNDPSVDEVSFVDLLADAAITDEAQLDQESLDHIAPPPGYIMTQAGGRQFIAGIAGRPNTIVASMLRSNGEPARWTDALTIDCPEAGGEIMALEAMGETLVIFKRDAIYRVRADVGPNNLGTAGSFLSPELVSSEQGCVGQRSVVVCPLGIMFAATRGIMLLDRSMSVRYIGSPLEGLTSLGTITGATCLPAKQQVRISGASLTHVYDYYHEMWSVFTHGSTGQTCEWTDQLAAIAGGAVVYDDSAVWTDAGTSYLMTLQLAWHRFPPTLQGGLRVQRVGITGESRAAHYLKIKVSHEYRSATEQTLNNTIASSGVLKSQWRLGQQVTSAVALTISDGDENDVVQATSGMVLDEVVFYAGVRSGLAR